MADNQNIQVKNEGLSYDTKTLIVVLTLIFAYPVGLILMFMWMKWKTWLKLLIAFPVGLIILAFMGVFAVGLLAVVNPSAQIQKGKCVAECRTFNETSATKIDCVKKCSVQ